MQLRTIRRLTVSVAALAGAIAVTPEPAGAITFGTPDTANTYANVGSLIVTIPDEGMFQLCTGTLIAPTVVLTASHCLVGFPDDWVIGSPGTTPTAGQDGVKELVLFSSTQNAPGNFGSLDLGTASNGTPELARQLRFGPNQSDFNVMQNANKLASDGSLQSPVSLGGDTGISNGTKDDWAAIIGKNKIIPLYDTVGGTGNNAVYHVVGFAGVLLCS